MLSSLVLLGLHSLKSAVILARQRMEMKRCSCIIIGMLYSVHVYIEVKFFAGAFSISTQLSSIRTLRVTAAQPMLPGVSQPTPSGSSDTQHDSPETT